MTPRDFSKTISSLKRFVQPGADLGALARATGSSYFTLRKRYKRGVPLDQLTEYKQRKLT